MSHVVTVQRNFNGEWAPVPLGAAVKPSEPIRLYVRGLVLNTEVSFSIEDATRKVVFNDRAVAGANGEAWRTLLAPGPGAYLVRAQGSSEFWEIFSRGHEATTSFLVTEAAEKPSDLPGEKDGVFGFLGDVQGLVKFLVIGAVIVAVVQVLPKGNRR